MDRIWGKYNTVSCWRLYKIMIKLYIQKKDLFLPLNFCSGKQEDGYCKSEDPCRDDSVLRKILIQISGAFFRLQDPLCPLFWRALQGRGCSLGLGGWKLSHSQTALLFPALRLSRTPEPCSPLPSRQRPSPRLVQLPDAERFVLGASLNSLYVIWSLSGQSFSARMILPPHPPPPFPLGDIWQHSEAFWVLNICTGLGMQLVSSIRSRDAAKQPAMRRAASPAPHSHVKEFSATEGSVSQSFSLSCVLNLSLFADPTFFLLICFSLPHSQKIKTCPRPSVLF